ncbi:MAG: P-type ATPase, partial [Anaerolineae bacterium]
MEAPNLIDTHRIIPTALSAREVLERRKEYGENILPPEKKIPWYIILINQFKSPLVYIILAAALVSLLVKEYGDFGIIMVVVVVDAILGFIQEFQAQNTYMALKSLLKPTTSVLRDDGNGPVRQEIDVSELVPGDLVLLNAGEKVPGDGEIVEGTKLALDESILTGESEPVSKSAALQLPIDNANKAFMGTTVLTGRGMLQVTQTGAKTELGQIATSLHENVEEDTPLQVRL